MSPKICPLYTKTFGGKIGKKLHSVSPDNFLDKNFKRVPPMNFPAKKIDVTIFQQKLNEKLYSGSKIVNPVQDGKTMMTSR